MTVVVIGDPQAPAQKFFDWLGHHRLLGRDGQLADGIRLVSIGDHFDYHSSDARAAGDDGIRVLRWLASHPPDRVVILLGNHDASRVMELATMTDARLAEAKRHATSIAELAVDDPRRAALVDAFHAAFPGVPAPGIVTRDYATFSEAQRALVIELLAGGRFHLAATGRTTRGRDVLLTHAGVTSREVGLLGLAESSSAKQVARALEDRLRAAVDAVRARWAAGEPAALDLSPLHIAGVARAEGGGLLYHRPANPDRKGADPWERQGARRFDPRALPRGLAQVCGHTNHEKAFRELAGWVAQGVDAKAEGHRTLRVDGERVSYELGVHDDGAEAMLVMIDPKLHDRPVEACQVLELADVEVT